MIRPRQLDIAQRKGITSIAAIAVDPDGQVVTRVQRPNNATLPDLPGIELAITSNEAFDLPQLPKRIVIIGGGYIACEFACIFNGLGVETLQLYRSDMILRGFDMDIREICCDEMRKSGVDVLLNVVAIASSDRHDIEHHYASS